MSSGGVVPATSQLRPRPLCPRLGWAGLGWAGLIRLSQPNTLSRQQPAVNTPRDTQPGQGQGGWSQVQCDLALQHLPMLHTAAPHTVTAVQGSLQASHCPPHTPITALHCTVPASAPEERMGIWHTGDKTPPSTQCIIV